MIGLGNVFHKYYWVIKKKKRIVLMVCVCVCVCVCDIYRDKGTQNLRLCRLVDYIS